MRGYLGLLLCAEGDTDGRLLGPILRKATEAFCLSEADHPVELSEIITLSRPPGREWVEWVVDEAQSAKGYWNLLFVHTDGAGQESKARAERIEPVVAALREKLGESASGAVAVVPVRETEAWALADGEALRSALGVRRTDAELGLMEEPNLEKIADPKALLDQACQVAVGIGRRRRRARGSDYLALIGEHASLDQLRRLAAFQLMEAELRSALVRLRVLNE